MKRNLFVALALLITALIVPPSRGNAALPDSATATRDVVPGEFLIKFRDAATPGERQAAIHALGGRSFGRIDSLGIEAVRLPVGHDGATMQAAVDRARAIEQHPLIEFAEPNGRVAIAETPEPEPAQTSPTRYAVYLPGITSCPVAINDPDRCRQYAWGMIKAFEGWNITRGSDGIVVAVIDTGTQLDHPDLRSKIVPGYDFVNQDDQPDDESVQGEANWGHGHGTHVAGTIGAITNNGIGVAGTCPECRIMPVRVLDNNGTGYISNVATGIVWATNNGAQVINLSLAGPTYSQSLENAINYAWQRGATVVCAAGNSLTDDFPGMSSNCLAVAATTESDTIAYFSNRGPWVEIAAPGEGIYSTWISGGYNTSNGTSMAAPHVAGVAGLLASRGLTNAQIRDRLCATADRIAGTGTNWSCGRLNLLRAVRGY